jgi:hypothetical protein
MWWIGLCYVRAMWVGGLVTKCAQFQMSIYKPFQRNRAKMVEISLWKVFLISLVEIEKFPIMLPLAPGFTRFCFRLVF